MTLISELIDIPRQVADGDFVLKLAEGVSDDHARATVDDYVVTTGIVEAFDDALGLIAGALDASSSKAAFLHGSFGSGKSHFMAILHLLLSGDPHALAKTELHPAYGPHADALRDKNILLVPMHFLAAKSMDSALFSQYVQHIQRLHPDTPLPAVYLSQGILEQELPRQRTLVGEEKFLATLNGDTASDDDWGDDFADVWTTQTVDAALGAPATAQESRKLTAAYISAFRPATLAETRSTGDGFVKFDDGLTAIAHHAKALGYDGIVFFLDELILWLASKIGDIKFVQEESAKLTKLVEDANMDRPVPIVSFVARQRDLKELVGEQVIGAELKALSDSLNQQIGRFTMVNLEDRDLAVIAKARVLEPVDTAAGTLLASGADQALNNRDEVRRVLAGSDADLELFRSVYPFTPALIETLIAVSEALQRERTALKVMLQMLVDHRDTLELGQFLPVGDLWDVVAAKDEPFSAELQNRFKKAKSLYRSKLRPMLLDEHNVTDETAEASKPFVRDDRILKTVLLAALVDRIDAFEGLTASKLVALNWGSVSSPIPGEEKTIVANQLRRWGVNVSELTVTDDPLDPVATITLVNVDTDEILRQAVNDFDNVGERRKAIQNLITDGLNPYAPQGLQGEVSVTWRGTDRTVDMRFGNLRNTDDVPDSALKATSTRPKIFIDYPFDEPGYGPDADLDRLNAFKADNEATPTLCWLPSFFSDEGQKQLRNYVALDMLLTGDRFEQHTGHLSESQKREAKPLLTEQRNSLKTQLTEAIRAAYGITGEHAYVDATRSLTDHFVSLDASLTIRPTTAPTFSGAFEQLYDQLYCALFPGHPDLGIKRITRGNRETALGELLRALGDPENRVVVDTPKRAITKLLAEGLELGTLAESNLVVNRTWYQRLERHLHDANEAGTSMTVGDIRTLIEHESGGPRGMPNELADLIVAVVAAQADHSFVHAGLAIAADGRDVLPSDTVLRREELPSGEDWTAATTKAGAVFGVAASKLVTAPEVARFAEAVRTKATEQRSAADDLLVQLEGAHRTLGGIEDGDRFVAATVGRDLVNQLTATKQPADVVDILVGFDPQTSNEVIAKSLSSAASTSAAIAGANWTLIEKFPSPADAARDALRKNELTDPLEPRLKAAEAEATRIATADAPPPPPTPVVPTPAGSSAVAHTVASRDEFAKLMPDIEKAIDAGASITIHWETSD